MGSSYQTVLAVGDIDAVRAAVRQSGQRAVIVPVGERRWAVIPEDEFGYAETVHLASLVSSASGGPAARFEVFDSDVLTAEIFRDGVACHLYLSEQGYLVEAWDDDDNEIMLDMLGRTYQPGVEPPRGPVGADPEAFAPLGIEPVDRAALGAALSGEEPMADHRHHDLLHRLNLIPGPLQWSYHEAVGQRGEDSGQNLA